MQRKISCIVEYKYETETTPGVFTPVRTEKLYHAFLSDVIDKPNERRNDSINSKVVNSFMVKIISDDKYKHLWNSIARVKIENTWYIVKKVNNFTPNLQLFCDYMA